jgi:hypothetical protein
MSALVKWFSKVIGGEYCTPYHSFQLTFAAFSEPAEAPESPGVLRGWGVGVWSDVLTGLAGGESACKHLVTHGRRVVP